MILVFISASLWGCLGCGKLPDGNISTELMEGGEEITFSTQRQILVRDILQLKLLSYLNVKKVLYSWGVFLIGSIIMHLFAMSVLHSHYYYPNTNTDFVSECSKCFLLG